MKITSQDLVTLEFLRDFFFEYKDAVGQYDDAKKILSRSANLVLRMDKHLDNEKKRKEEK